MKYDKFFQIAKSKGLEECELNIVKSENLSFSYFHSELDKFENSASLSILARGIVDGKMGVASANYYDNRMAETLVDNIIENAKLIESDEPSIIYKGSPKYHRVNTFNKELSNISLEVKKEKMLALENKIRQLDQRIIEVEGVEYNENMSERLIYNSKGLKLHRKRNNYSVFASALAAENDQVKSDFIGYVDNNFSKIDIDKLASNLVNKCVSKLNPVDAITKTYKAVISNEVMATFVDVLVSYASSEDVQKHSSLFEGKLGTQVVNKKVSISDMPLLKTVYSTSFDDEGVATRNFDIIKNGVLKNYLYNLRTAKIDNVESTGNGSNAGSRVSIAPNFIVMKKGKLSLEDLFKKMDNGVYITGVQGLHAGLNRQSGNFSLQASGYQIENGQISRPFDIFTISGNILDIFNDIKYIASDNELNIYGSMVPSVLIKKLSIAGK